MSLLISITGAHLVSNINLNRNEKFDENLSYDFDISFRRQEVKLIN